MAQGLHATCDRDGHILQVLGTQGGIRRQSDALGNIATGSTDKQIMPVVKAGAIQAVCSVLDVNDIKMCLVTIDTVNDILKSGVNLNKDYASFILKWNGLTMIETPQKHESDHEI